MTVYPFIEAERVEQRNVRRACDLLEVSRTAFYQWVRHDPSKRELDDRELGEHIEKIHDRSRGTYGPPGFTPSSGARASPPAASGWRGS